MTSAHVEVKTGDAISTTFLNNSAVLGTTGFYAIDTLVSVEFESQTPTQERVKKSGVGNYRTIEGALKPAPFKMKLHCQSGMPLSWIHACVTAIPGAYKTHTMSVPVIQQPTSAATALPKLAFRVEGEASDTNAKDIVDLIGCAVKEIKLTVEDGGKFSWDVSGEAAVVIRGQSAIASAATDPTTTVYGWEHGGSNMFTFTYGGVNVGLEITGMTCTWTSEVEWIQNAPMTFGATVYRVYQTYLHKNWDYTVELKGKPVFDGTLVSIKTIMSTAVASLSATLFKWNPVRTTTSDEISYSCSLMQPAPNQTIFNLNRETSDYETLDVKLVTKEDFAITAVVGDALAETYYENTA